jgi:hypothetical protein
LFIFSIPLFFPGEVSAVPGFARQTGFSCNTCHFQHYPALNVFGRAFKSGGYTMAGGQSLIEAEMLSIPVVLNASLVFKVRYQKENGSTDSDKDRGELQFPDEGVLFVGGRAGEHVGFLLEVALPEEDSFASFRVPFVYDVAGGKLNIVPFTTDGLGASFGFELLNTGAVRNIRALEERKAISAQQFIGTADEAQGITLAYAKNIGFINWTLWQPEHGNSDYKPFAHYLRAAATPVIAGWDLGIGGQYWKGSGRDSDTGSIDIDAWAVDAQAQGLVASLPLGVYLTYANADENPGDVDLNIFNSNPDDKTAFSILAELGVLPNRATIATGYLDGDRGSASNSEDNAFLVAATFLVAQNVELQASYISFDGDFYDANPDEADERLTLMMKPTSA